MMLLGSGMGGGCGVVTVRGGEGRIAGRAYRHGGIG